MTHRLLALGCSLFASIACCACTASTSSPNAPGSDAGIDAHVADAGTDAKSADDGGDANAPEDSPSSEFPLTPGSSIWFSAIDTVSIEHRRDPVGPPLAFGDGGSLANPCDVGFRPNATFSFVVASRTLTWHWTCEGGGDGATSPGADGNRALTTDEANTLVATLQSVDVVASTAGASDADVAKVTTHVGSASQTYADTQSVHQPTDVLVSRLADVIAEAYSLSHP